MQLKLKKIIGLSAAVTLVAAWFTSAILENIYVNYPRTPDSREGRTVPHAVKGIVVYITQSQFDLLSWLRWLEIGSGATAALVILIHRGDPFSKS